MPISLRYDGRTMIRMLTLMFLPVLAFAGADPDEYRPTQDGNVRYDGTEVQVGKTYEAFLISKIHLSVAHFCMNSFAVAVIEFLIWRAY